MAYLKYGVATRIDVKGNIENTFNLDFFIKKDNSYFIKEQLLNDNFWSLREEFLSYTGEGDSINDSDAYILEENINNIAGKEIILSNDFYKYKYSGYNFEFDTDFFIESTEESSIEISFIPIYWNTSPINSLPFNILMLLNNLTTKCLVNQLKEASLFAVI